MTRFSRCAALVLVLAMLLGARHPALAAGMVLTGLIVDLEGRPVQGAELYAYETPQVRRPADFISRATGQDGEFRLELPAGKYWLVARQRSGARYGPLATGGRHSGEAREVEGGQGEEVYLDFTVADLKDMAAQAPRTENGYLGVEGRILDQDGIPVAGAYAFARDAGAIDGLPRFISAYTDASGSYDLQLPPGSYLLGAAATFPPGDAAPTSPVEVGEAAVSRELRVTVAPKLSAAPAEESEKD